MNRRNLKQLVNFLNNELNMPNSASYFADCVNYRNVVVNGWIEADFVKRHVVIGVEADGLENSRSTRVWREIQANVTTSIEIPEKLNFTFETERDQDMAEMNGYIESYDCVRVEVMHSEGGILDFPIKNRESFNQYLKSPWYEGQIVNIYPTVHSYDLQDYL
jgi:hypothetical protein